MRSKWKEGTPELILILVHQKKGKLLDHCGRANEFEDDHGELTSSIEDSGEWEVEDGLWIVPGAPVYTKDYWGEVDGGWKPSGPLRRLTDEEWELYRTEDVVWPLEWEEIPPVDTTCEAPSPEESTCDDEQRWMFFVELSECNPRPGLGLETA